MKRSKLLDEKVKSAVFYRELFPYKDQPDSAKLTPTTQLIGRKRTYNTRHHPHLTEKPMSKRFEKDEKDFNPRDSQETRMPLNPYRADAVCTVCK